MHSFVKDHVLYNKFMNISNNAKKTNIYNLHMTNLLHLGLQEVMTWNQVKMGKFMGRVLFIYLDITPSELKKYGYKYDCCIFSFGTLGGRAAVRDVG